MSKDNCQYNNCNHPLGEWIPTREGNEQGMIDCAIRSCEKCGGEQWRGSTTDRQLVKDVDKLFDCLSQDKGDCE